MNQGPEGLICLLVSGFFLLIVLALPMAWYNKLVRLRQLIRESWGNVDVQLRRRYDLIPNLAETVKGYAKHEQSVLEQVIQARNRAHANTGAVHSQASDEQHLVQATRHLLAVAEAYPELKASPHFLALQQELVNTEDRIAAARRFYNGNVRDYNTARTTFPTLLVAGFGDFPPAEFFEVDDYTVRQPPAVQLT